MTILSQSFLTLVGSHLVAFSFLSAGHNSYCLIFFNQIFVPLSVVLNSNTLQESGRLFLFYAIQELTRGLERRNLMFRYDDGSVL